MPSRLLLIRERKFVIDGTNILLLHGRAYPELRYLLALCACIDNNGGDFVCFFDANTRYLIEEHRPDQLKAFDHVITEEPWAGRLQIVASGTEADESILKAARIDRSEVISNDKFRSRAKKNRWIWRRRHPVQVVDGCLVIRSLEALITVFATADEYLVDSGSRALRNSQVGTGKQIAGAN